MELVRFPLPRQNHKVGRRGGAEARAANSDRAGGVGWIDADCLDLEAQNAAGREI